MGWRGVFWALAPIAVVNLIWQWMSLPAMPPQRINSVGKILELLKRRNVAFAMLGVMFTFAGALPLSLTCDHFSRLTLGLACVNCRSCY
jgi:predicted MFS family arabinose efflux permease